jgi:hypothetical protein
MCSLSSFLSFFFVFFLLGNRFLQSSCNFMQMSGVIWHQGDHAGSVIILLQGEMVKRTKSGIYERIVPGEIVGDTCLCEYDRRFYTLETVQPKGLVGKYSKRRRSNVAVIIVRIVFISSFLFYCLLLNHSFQTNPNRITNYFKRFSIATYNYIAPASLCDF